MFSHTNLAIIKSFDRLQKWNAENNLLIKYIVRWAKVAVESPAYKINVNLFV